MQRRVFNYGESRKATVQQVAAGMLICVDELNEGHVIIGGEHDPANVGDQGELVFTKGGPTGGYWRFTKP